MHVWESGGTATSWNTLCGSVRELPPFTSIPNHRKCRISEEPLHDKNEIYSTSYSWIQKLSAIENCDESEIPVNWK